MVFEYQMLFISRLPKSLFFNINDKKLSMMLTCDERKEKNKRYRKDGDVMGKGLMERIQTRILMVPTQDSRCIQCLS